MNAAELAALVAAVFWALLVCVGVFVLFRLGLLLSESSKLVADVRERGDVLLTRAQAAVDWAQAAVDGARSLSDLQIRIVRLSDLRKPIESKNRGARFRRTRSSRQATSKQGGRPVDRPASPKTSS